MKWLVVIEYINGDLIDKYFDSYKKAVTYVLKDIASQDIVPYKTKIYKYTPV